MNKLLNIKMILLVLLKRKITKKKKKGTVESEK